LDEEKLTTQIPGDCPDGQSDSADAAREQPPPPFFSDFVELVYGLFFAPTATLRSVARRASPPLGVGLFAYLVVAFINGLAAGGSMTQAMRRIGADLAPAIGAVPPGLLPGGDALAGSGFLVTMALAAVLLGPVLLFIKTAVLGLTSSFLGGRGDGRRLLAAFGLTYLPALVAVPVNLLIAGRPGFGALATLLTLAILAWRLVLDIIAIREVHALGTGRAAAAALIPLGAGLVLAIVFFFLSMALMLSILGPMFQSGLPGVG
jgi:hypothetical protein